MVVNLWHLRVWLGNLRRLLLEAACAHWHRGVLLHEVADQNLARQREEIILRVVEAHFQPRLSHLLVVSLERLRNFMLPRARVSVKRLIRSGAKLTLPRVISALATTRLRHASTAGRIGRNLRLVRQQLVLMPHLLKLGELHLIATIDGNGNLIED